MGSQGAVRPVAERQVFGMAAAAPGHRPLLGHLYFFRDESSAFMRAVAEWLGFRAAAGTVEVNARFRPQHQRGFLENDRFFHRWLFLVRNRIGGPGFVRLG